MTNKAYNLPIEDLLELLQNLQAQGCTNVNVTVLSESNIGIAGIEPEVKEEPQKPSKLNNTDFSQLIP